ncbi:MAG TPA: adenylosuccinate synthase [Sedimentisphaerales bacterium]|nr:adenylosuccinate synthase [Sedimentisphaerales bacterium]
MNTCVVGLQWGDEGKGKIVDILAENKDIVVRYNGGANAGHTVVVNETKFALHLLPSGAVRPNIVCVIGNGVVVDPQCLTEEIENLAREGITLEKRLFISENAHLVLDYHKTEDQLREQSLGKDKLGTTVRGIGPCYADKVSRNYAVRMSDLRQPEKLCAKLRSIVDYKNKVFAAVYNAEPTSFEQVYEKCRIYGDKFRAYITDTTQFLHKAIADGKSVLFEGAQGSLLDIDHGTFPFVTSSNSSSLGMSAGCGIPAKMVDEFVGVIKAYTTRVGAGPFPTEQDNETGQYIRQRGHEYGTTTGRPRRCGWFDAVAVLYSATIGGIDSLALVHLDTLTGLKEIKVCTAYRINGKETTFFPANSDRLSEVECVYKTLPGWDNDISGVKDFDSLPQNTRDYIRFIEEKTGRPVTITGVGPKRDQTIIR